MLIASAPEGLCLDFANTLCWRGRPAPSESLHDLGDVIGWLEASPSLHPGALGTVTQWSEANREAAGGLFAEQIAVREAVYGTFSAVAAGDSVGEADFAALSEALAAAPARTRLQRRAGGDYGWEVPPPRPAVADILAPVLWSAGDLLFESGRRLVRRCANPECLWLFLDHSKAGTRRWCDMTSCGNRAKARRHYAKVKAG